MIRHISKSLTNLLSKNNIIDENKKDIYTYGYEIMISNLLGLSITLVLGAIISNVWYAVLFYIAFVSVRQFTGGFHANSYLSCNIIFTATVALVLIASSALTMCCSSYYYAIVFSAHIIILFCFSPVDNKHKPLSQREKKKHKKTGIALSLFWCVVAVVFRFLWLQASVTITVTLVAISVLLLIGNLKEGRCNNEKG